MLVALVLVMVVMSSVAFAEDQTAYLPAGTVRMMNVSEGRLYIQMAKYEQNISAIYQYDETSEDYFTLLCEIPINGVSLYSFVVGNNVYYTKNDEPELIAFNPNDGQSSKTGMRLFTDKFSSGLSNIQPFILSYSMNDELTYMITAEKGGKDIFFLCRLYISNGEFLYFEVPELRSFTNLKNGETIFFSVGDNNLSEMMTLVNKFNWTTLASEPIGMLPLLARSYVYDNEGNSCFYVLDKRIYSFVPGYADEMVRDMSAIPLYSADQRGFMIDDDKYVFFYGEPAMNQSVVPKVAIITK